MSTLYLAVKSLHIIFVASWFASLFYLPRIFVNLAMVNPGSHAERERLILMASRLYRFGTLLMLVALVCGLWLWLGFDFWRGPGNLWLHIKLALVLAVIGYHFLNRALLRGFEQGRNQHTQRWFRVYNEVSVLLFAAIVLLVVFKPF